MMTQAIVSPSKVDPLKLSGDFDGVFCDAEVDSLMQIGDDVDNCSRNLSRHNNTEKSNNKQQNENLKGGNRQQKRKTRRGRNKSARQTQQPYYGGVTGGQTELLRRQKLRQDRNMTRSLAMLAPDNTTQFIMSDRNYSDSDLDKSSGEDTNNESNFAQREFSKDYEKMAANKQKLPIAKLIEEYLMYEAEVKELERKYQEMTTQEQVKARLGQVDYDWEKGEIAMEPDVAEKITVFHSEIAKIREENRLLEEENLSYRSQTAGDSSDLSSSDSSDSSSDSDSSSSDSSSDSSEDEDEEEEGHEAVTDEAVPVPSSTDEDLVKVDNEQRKDDTGYESGGSSNDLMKVTSTTLRK